MAQYPWPKIFEKYETGKYTWPELADEYGFNWKYAARKANEEGVEKGASREKIEKEAAKKVREEEVNKEAELRQEYEKIINNIRRGAINTLFQEKDFKRLKQFKIASEIIRNCRKEQWEVNEILSAAQKADLESQEDKLDKFIQGVHDAPVTD